MPRIVLVMAGSYGIGGAISTMLFKKGWSIVVFCRGKPEALSAESSLYADRLGYHLFLFSDETTYISGQSIAVDGDLSSGRQSNV